MQFSLGNEAENAVSLNHSEGRNNLLTVFAGSFRSFRGKFPFSIKPSRIQMEVSLMNSLGLGGIEVS